MKVAASATFVPRIRSEPVKKYPERRSKSKQTKCTNGQHTYISISSQNHLQRFWQTTLPQVAPQLSVSNARHSCCGSFLPGVHRTREENALPDMSNNINGWLQLLSKRRSQSRKNRAAVLAMCILMTVLAFTSLRT